MFGNAVTSRHGFAYHSNPELTDCPLASGPG